MAAQFQYILVLAYIDCARQLLGSFYSFEQPFVLQATLSNNWAICHIKELTFAVFDTKNASDV